MLNSILFTHNDLDGAGCRIIYELAHHYEKKGDDYDVLTCPINKLDEMVTEELNKGRIHPDRTAIYFADICAKPETLQTLKAKRYRVFIFDHHETNLPALEVYPNGVIMERNTLGKMVSGTSLLFQYFVEMANCHPSWETSKYFLAGNNKQFERIALFVDTVRSYDTFEWKETNNILAKELQTLFLMLGIENFCKKYTTDLQEEHLDTKLISDSDMMFVQSKIDFEQSVIDNFTTDDVIPMQLLGEVDGIMHTGCMVIATKGASISELAYQFLQKHQEFEFIIGFNFNFPGSEISFRARDDSMQLGQNFAARLGGGGHPKAAGAPFPIKAKEDLMELFMRVLTGAYTI